MDIDIYLITLDRDENRRQIFFDNLPDCWSKDAIKVFSAVNGQTVEIPPWFFIPKSTLKGRYGCYKSHVEIMKLVDKPTLILEDDVIFEDTFCDKFYYAIEAVKDWNYDILYLGGKNVYKPIDTNIKHIQKSIGTIYTHSYFLPTGIAAKKIVKLLESKYIWSEYLTPPYYEIDLLLNRLLYSGIISGLCINPYITRQNRYFISTTKQSY